MKIYISGKITGLDYMKAFEKFEQAETLLLEKGFTPVNPMKKTSELEGKTWKQYMLEDIEILWDCDAIFMLSDWEDSKGARLELVVAKELGLSVFYNSLTLELTDEEFEPLVK